MTLELQQPSARRPAGAPVGIGHTLKQPELPAATGQNVGTAVFKRRMAIPFLSISLT
jgi:hypothetical protein